jgi:hypothetical protein
MSHAATRRRWHDQPGSLSADLCVQANHQPGDRDDATAHARCRHASGSGGRRVRRRIACVGAGSARRASPFRGSGPRLRLRVSASTTAPLLIVDGGGDDDQTRRRYSSLFDDGSTTSSANRTFLTLFAPRGRRRRRSCRFAPSPILTFMSASSRRWRWYEMRMMPVDTTAMTTSPRQLPAPLPLRFIVAIKPHAFR